MTSTPPTSHPPARRRPTTAILTTAALALAAAAAFAAVSALAPSAASAIPAPQKACASPGLTLSGGTGPYQPMGVSVTVNDGTSSRNIVAFTSLDGNVAPNGEMRLSWSVDGAAVTDFTYGPGNIAENQQFDGTRTVMDVIPLGPGTHTLTPEVRLSGISSITGIVDRLCVVAEAFTK
jgi:hypothetical protein